MPRSERVYVYALVGVMSLVVIFSVVAAVRSLRGDQEVRPDYENAPPKAFIAPPADSIVNLSNIEGAPVSDEDFLLFHETTRTLTPLLAARGAAEASDVVLDQSVIDTAQQRLDQFNSLLASQRRSAAQAVSVINPVSRVCDLAEATCQAYCPEIGEVRVCQRARSSARVTFVRVTADGEPSPPSIVSVNWEWLDTPDGWRVIDIAPELVSSGSADVEPAPNAPADDGPDPGVDPDAPVISP